MEHTRRNPPLTSGREECSTRLLEPNLLETFRGRFWGTALVPVESSASLDMVVDIDQIVASPWIGLHYRHEFLLHHRHESLESDPRHSTGNSETLADETARPKP